MKAQRYLPLLAALMLVVSACGDNPVEHDDEEHSHVEGLTLVVNGEEVYWVIEGEVGCAEAPCGITVPEQELTSLIRVEFVDEEGDLIHDDDFDEAFGLDFEIADPAVAEIEHHEDDGRFAFHVRGLSAGETALQVKLMHVDHADFTSPPLSDSKAITISVTQE